MMTDTDRIAQSPSSFERYLVNLSDAMNCIGQTTTKLTTDCHLTPPDAIIAK